MNTVFGYAAATFGSPPSTPIIEAAWWVFVWMVALGFVLITVYVVYFPAVMKEFEAQLFEDLVFEQQSE